MKNQRAFTLIELLIVLAIVGIVVAFILSVAMRPSRENRCQELCDGLRQRMIKVTPDACICEDLETKRRQAYPMNDYNRTSYPPSQPYNNGVWEED